MSAFDENLTMPKVSIDEAFAEKSRVRELVECKNLNHVECGRIAILGLR